MKKIIKIASCFFALLLVFQLTSVTVLASTLSNTQTDQFTITQSGLTYTLYDKENDEYTTISYNPSYTSFTITYEDGIRSVGYKDSEGNFWIDNQIIAEKMSGGISQQAVPSGFRYYTSYSYSFSQVATLAGIIATLLGLIPGLGGASVIAGVLIGLLGIYNDVYITVYQYINDSDMTNVRAYDVCYTYQYSNYTGLLDVTEHGPYKYGR